MPSSEVAFYLATLYSWSMLLTLSHVCNTRRAASPEGQALFQNCALGAIILTQFRITVDHATVGAHRNLEHNQAGVYVYLLTQQEMTQSVQWTIEKTFDPPSYG